MKTEMVMCSAIWVQDENMKLTHYPTNVTYGLVVCGYRHCNCFDVLSTIYARKHLASLPTLQGFLTNNNRFIDRVEAKRIAAATDQLLAPTQLLELYLEDVWLIHHDKGGTK